MTGMIILCLCACAVMTSASLYNRYPTFGINNYNPHGYFNSFQSGYPVGMWGQRGMWRSGGHGLHSRYRRSVYGQPRFPYQRFNGYGGQFNQFGYQPWYGNNGYNRMVGNRQYW